MANVRGLGDFDRIGLNGSQIAVGCKAGVQQDTGMVRIDSASRRMIVNSGGRE